ITGDGTRGLGNVYQMQTILGGAICFKSDTMVSPTGLGVTNFQIQGEAFLPDSTLHSRIWYETEICLGDTGNGFAGMGLSEQDADSIVVDCVDGIFFRIDDDSTWQFVIENNGVEATRDLSNLLPEVADVLDWHRFGFTVKTDPADGDSLIATPY
ncbi:unnamed protein product, partial [marine sediment metagenome]